MITDTEKELEKIFLSYNRILEILKLKNITTKSGKEITHKDLRKAIYVMEEKHPTCRWKSQKVRSKRYYILVEGYDWLERVYFQKEKSLVDADIDFFIARIKLYEELLHIKSKVLFNDDMKVKNLSIYFNRKQRTIEKAIIKMLKIYPDYRYKVNNEFLITKDGIKWLCENCFKQKYLEILEQYKMELTEKYIKAGYIYDYYFGIN